MVISCKSEITRQSTATDIGSTSVPIYLKPLRAAWWPADDNLIQQENTSIAIDGFYLNGQATILAFRLSGAGFEAFTPGIPVQITDETGYSSKLLRVIPLGMIDKLAVGMMVFEPRRVGASKLYLHWPSVENGAPLEKLIAYFSGEPWEDYGDRTYFARPRDPVNLDGYQITVGWWIEFDQQNNEATAAVLSPEATEPGPHPTSTAYVPQPLAELAPGVSIMTQCSLFIKNSEKGQIQTINIQLLTDTDAILQSNGVVSMPGPIIINEPVPTPVPSAYP
jgi:hypothetical protein